MKNRLFSIIMTLVVAGVGVLSYVVIPKNMPVIINEQVELEEVSEPAVWGEIYRDGSTYSEEDIARFLAIFGSDENFQAVYENIVKEEAEKTVKDVISKGDGYITVIYTSGKQKTIQAYDDTAINKIVDDKINKINIGGSGTQTKAAAEAAAAAQAAAQAALEAQLAAQAAAAAQGSAEMTINCADGPHKFPPAKYNFIKGFWSYTGDWEAMAHKHTAAELDLICQIEGGIS